jgi:DNA replication protein DnaC
MIKESERRDFLEICDDRYQRRSLILTSQVPLAHWHEQIGDPTIADSILDRRCLRHHIVTWEPQQHNSSAGAVKPSSDSLRSESRVV